MEDNNALKKKNSVKSNLYNYSNGLTIMVNLLIINTMFYGMKKADIFYEEKEDSKKRKSIRLFGDLIPISRKRFNRIKNGENFRIYNKEAESIADTFGIDIKYFRKEDPILLDISQERAIKKVMWEGYFSSKYGVAYKVKEKDAEGDKEIIDSELQLLKSKDWLNYSDKNDPLFRIGYYFSTGERYEPISKVDKCIKALKEVDFKEWDSKNPDKLEGYRQLFKNHYDYINSLLVIHHLKNDIKK